MLQSQWARLAALALTAAVQAETVYYDWGVDWVSGRPDGYTRPVIGINGQWPCPTLEAEAGDTVIVRLTNNLGNQTTGLHWHGITQRNTTFMDGASMVTQCPIPPGETFVYKFEVPVPGTYWYHSHNMGQYSDGLRGPIIVHDPKDPYSHEYDEDHTLSMSDWYHLDTIALGRSMFTVANNPPRPPFPDSILINDIAKAPQIKFKKDTVHRIRLINFSALSSFLIDFTALNAEVIAVDSLYVEKYTVRQLRLAPAQRYDFLISCKDNDLDNYPFHISLDRNRDFSNPEEVHIWALNQTGHFVTDEKKRFPEQVVHKWDVVHDSDLKQLNPSPPLPPADKTIVLDFEPCKDDYGLPRLCFNGQPYIDQKVPALFTAATTGEYNTNPKVYGYVNPYIISEGDIVDIVVNNIDPVNHPFHLHGHHFEVVDLPPSGVGNWPGKEAAKYYEKPLKRDTVTIMRSSYGVIRFKADNPGVWLFHCHIEWHVELGLTATIIEAPEKLRGLEIPEEHLDLCRKQDIPYSGNAGGNYDDPLDETNFRSKPHREYYGAEFPRPPEESVDAPPRRRSRIARAIR